MECTYIVIVTVLMKYRIKKKNILLQNGPIMRGMTNLAIFNVLVIDMGEEKGRNVRKLDRQLSACYTKS